MGQFTGNPIYLMVDVPLNQSSDYGKCEAQSLWIAELFFLGWNKPRLEGVAIHNSGTDPWSLHVSIIKTHLYIYMIIYKYLKLSISISVSLYLHLYLYPSIYIYVFHRKTLARLERGLTTVTVYWVYCHYNQPHMGKNNSGSKTCNLFQSNLQCIYIYVY